MHSPIIEVPTAKIRAVLAERKISRKALAEAANLDVRHVSRILCDSFRAGELATLKLQRGLRSLGIVISEFSDA